MILVLGTRPLFNFQGLCTAIPKLDGDQILTQDWGWHDGPLWHEHHRECEGQVTRTVTLFVQSPDHPIVTFSLSVVIHFSAKSPENNVNLMIPPFTAAWLRFLFGKFLLTCCGLWKTEKHVDNNKILQPLATDWCSPGKMYISTQSFDEKFQGTRKKTRKLKSPNSQSPKKS